MNKEQILRQKPKEEIIRLYLAQEKQNSYLIKRNKQLNLKVNNLLNHQNKVKSIVKGLF